MKSSSLFFFSFLIFGIDLRAVLRLQPNNKEALLELAALIHPITQDQDPTLANYLNPSSSRQQSRTEPGADTLRRLGVPKPKPIKQPPFPKTTADERKLKIVMLSGAEGFSSNRRHGQSTTSRQGKEKAGTKRSKTMREIEKMRIDCPSYPGWDRYVVKKVD